MKALQLQLEKGTGPGSLLATEGGEYVFHVAERGRKKKNKIKNKITKKEEESRRRAEANVKT